MNQYQADGFLSMIKNMAKQEGHDIIPPRIQEGIKLINQMLYPIIPEYAQKRMESAMADPDSFLDFYITGNTEQEINTATDGWMLILRFIKEVVCSYDADRYVWMISYLQTVFFQQKIRLNFYVILQGDSGCGKSVFIKLLLEHMLGKACGTGMKTFDPTYHRTIDKHLLLSCFDEMPTVEQQYKVQIMTQTGVNFGGKQKNDKLIMYPTNFIFSTDKKLSDIKLMKQKCNPVVIPMSNKRVGDTAFFAQLHKAFTPTNINLAANYIKDFKYSIDVTDLKEIPPIVSDPEHIIKPW